MNATADSGKQDTTPKAAAGNTAVPHGGDHDRVQLLSLRADGTPDQHNPEMIDASDATREATREQFAQQAVSAADVERAHVKSGPMMVVEGKDGETELKPASDAPQDPSIKGAQDELGKVDEAARKAADAAVDKLTKD
jgi:hypothetical protein